MLMYVGYYEIEEMRADENPPVSIILCAGKNEAMARYALSKTGQQIFAARYQMHLPSEEELRAELIRERDALLLERGLTTDETS